MQLDGAGSGGGGNNGVCIAGCRRDTNCPFGQVCADVSAPGGTRVEKVLLILKTWHHINLLNVLSIIGIFEISN